jgi:response regulator RpfG family c-di-GMP phosphodiesterase
MTELKPVRILCADDEPNILDGLSRQLRHHFSVTTAVGGAAGLQKLDHEGPFAAVVSDLRMPGMDGVAFLRSVREVAPETVRVLLTGQADLNAAIAAVNEGAIFRFLTKPCPLEILLPALQAASEQYRLITAERILLKETLQGSIKALIDILAQANPVAFGQAMRAKQFVAMLTTHLGMRDSWQVEVAAMLSQVGCVTLPAATAEKLYNGTILSPTEEAMVDRLPEVTSRLLANIPRLEQVRDILLYLRKHFDGSGPPEQFVFGEAIPWGARVLKVVLDFDVLQTQGLSTVEALKILRNRAGWYDNDTLEEFAKLIPNSVSTVEKINMPLSKIREGMIFDQDVKTRTGRLLIARGHEVTASLLERIKNLSSDLKVQEPIRVIARKQPMAAAPV